MEADIGTYPSLAVERLIKCRKDISLSWKTAESDGIKYSVGCLQGFLDKSQVSLSTGAQQFCPGHVTIFNCSKER